MSEQIEHDQMTIDDRRWVAVADPGRRKLLDLLLEHGPATSTALARELPVTRQAIAKQLAVLERAGLVTATRSGRERRWSARNDAVAAAMRSIAAAAAAWDARLAALKQLAEATNDGEDRR